MSKGDEKPTKFNKEAMHAFFRILSANHGGYHKIAMPPADSLEPGDRINWHLEPGMDHPEMKITPFQEIVFQRYGELKEKYGYGGKTDAFDDLREQLINENKDPEKYGLKFDTENFDKKYRRWRKKQLRKK